MPTLQGDLRYPKLITYTQIPDESEKAAFYAERSNKVFLYLFASVITGIVVFLVVGISALQNIGDDNLLKLVSFLESHGVYFSQELIHELKLFNPLTNTLFLFAAAFISFVIFDISRKEHLDSVLGQDRFKQSTAVSYSLHLSIFALIILLMLFTLRTKPKVQTTQIEFIPAQVPTRIKPKPSKYKATKNSVDSGKHNPKQEVKPPTQRPGEPKLPAQPAKPAPKAQPKAAAPNQPTELPSPKRDVKTQAPISSKPSPVPKLMTPQPKTSLEGMTLAKPNPDGKMLPKLLSYDPNTASNSTSVGSSPAPKIGGSVGDARNSNIVARLSNIPRAPDSVGDGQGGARGDAGNPPPNSYPNGAPSVAATQDLNFGPYMSSLQRKIKLAWKPPRGTESNRIVVNFSVLRSGQLSNLTLVRKSASVEANNAALDAVTDAAPFDPLPEGAGNSIDIEFTFDYSVFQKSRW